MWGLSSNESLYFCFFTLYNYAGEIFFSKAISLDNSGKVRSASLAHQIVFTKYPFSALSPISRINYGILAVKGKVRISGAGIFQKHRDTLSSITGIRGWSPYYSDGFPLFCILFYGILSLIFTMLGEKQADVKKLFWKRMVLSLSLLVLYGLWAGFAGMQISATYNSLVYLLFAVSFGLWSVAGIILVIRTLIIISQSMVSQDEGGSSNMLVNYSNSKRAFYPFLIYIFVFGLTFYLTAASYNLLPTQNRVEKQSKSVYIVNSSNGLNLRLGPGTNYKIKKALKNGQRVELIQTHNSWAHIRFYNTEGWVFAKYLKKQ